MPNKNLSSANTKLMTPSPRAPSNNNNICSPANNNSTPLATTTNYNMTAAAGSAAFEMNSTMNQFHIDPELEAGLLQEQLASLNNNDLNKTGTKFLGMYF